MSKNFSALCRTCIAPNVNNLKVLTSPTKKYPEKNLSDLLLELAIMNMNVVNFEKLPQEICENCTQQLENAYYFVVQARETQKKLLDLLKESSVPMPDAKLNTRDCLQEIPMEVYPDVIIKEEMEVSEGELLQENSNELVSSGSSKSLDPLSKYEQSSEESSSNDELDNIPLKKSKTILKQSDISIPQKKDETERKYKCDKCDKAYLWPQNLQNHKRTHILKKDMMSCPHCSQKFFRKETFELHLKKHGERNVRKRPANLSEEKQAKNIDLNMCKPNGCKLIQCMLCLGKYSKFSELRSHMQHHLRNVSFADRRDHLREIAESFYPDLKNLSEEELLSRIRRDLEAEKYALFYSITNDSGYELSLDSSETESDLDNDIDGDTNQTEIKNEVLKKLSYACELCKASFRRKFELFEHQRQQHAWEDAPWICTRCDARFISEKLLKHHYKSLCKNSLKRFACSKCPLRFRWKHNIKAHYRDHKKKKEVYECTQCGRSYDDKKSYSIHVLKVHTHQSNLMPCHWCNRKFYRRDYLIKHLRRHGLKEKDLPLAETHIAATAKANGMKNITCKVCNINFERIADLRGHLQLELKLALSIHQNFESLLNYSITNESGFELHLEDSETDDDEDLYTSNQIIKLSYTCELCKVSCRRKFEIMQHQRTMHRFDNLPFACETCIFKTVSKDVFQYHKLTQCLNSEKKYLCDICGYKFMWMENMETHKRMQHSTEKLYVENSSGDNRSNLKAESQESSSAVLPTLQCPHCDRTYVLQSRLNNHIRDVHIEGDRKKKEAQQKFLCSLCGKELHSASYLEAHMRRHTGEKPFKCDLCEMTFARQSDVRCHRRKHTGEKPFHCTICGKDFARSDKLKRHMLTHSGLKPYKCSCCEKSYRQSKDLAIHMQQHTGESPFICGTCGERFLQNSTLEKHRMMRGHFDKAE